ncbi:MAG TPA: isocitrate/isopropylmalate family dehydrogenase [Acetobacteraceae bacterium]|jgi:3-isopropylmalate dehydrogenase
MKLLVLPGDGIGPEITAAAMHVLQAASRRFNLGIDATQEDVGHASLQRHGTTVRPELLAAAKAADGLILGPTATFDFKDPARGEINPSMFFRKELDLFANIRPSRTYKGSQGPVGEFDLVVVRENTEGFYADRNVASGGSEMLITPDVVVSLRRITRLCCERIARAAFELAQRRRKHVTLVHKANVLRLGDGMFLEECRKVAQDFPDIAVDDIIVDAMMAHAVRKPQRFDVIVTTNMFGDILSDLTAELSGSIGLGGSLNAGGTYAMAQASHGSAPDIAGRDIANPFSLVLSVSLLLSWLGRTKHKPEYEAAAEAIETGVEAAVADGDVTFDIGGNLSTQATGERLAARIFGG